MAKAVFTEDAGRRIAEATRTVERTPPEQRVDGASPSFRAGVVHVCKLDEALAAGGSALATIRVFNGTSWDDGTVQITVYDHSLDSGTTVASGSTILVAPTGAAYVYIDGKCEDIS